MFCSRTSRGRKLRNRLTQIHLENGRKDGSVGGSEDVIDHVMSMLLFYSVVHRRSHQMKMSQLVLVLVTKSYLTKLLISPTQSEARLLWETALCLPIIHQQSLLR